MSDMTGEKLEQVANVLDIMQSIVDPLFVMIDKGIKEIDEEHFEVALGYSKAQFEGWDFEQLIEWVRGTSMQDDLRRWAKEMNSG